MKGLTVSVFSFAGHMVCRGCSALLSQWESSHGRCVMNGRGCVPINLYAQAGWWAGLGLRARPQLGSLCSRFPAQKEFADVSVAPRAHSPPPKRSSGNAASCCLWSTTDSSRAGGSPVGRRPCCLPSPERHWWILVPLQEAWQSFLQEEPGRESVFCAVHTEFLCSVAVLYLLRRKSEMVGSRSVPYRLFSSEPSLPASQGPTGTAGHRQSLAS